jgi:hypothetical protein
VAGPLGGTLAKALGAASNGVLSAALSAVLSGAAGAAAQEASNLIDPCNAISPWDAALWSALGGGLSKKFFPTKNLNTWSQAANFGPATLSGLFSSTNAWLNIGSLATSAGLGAASNFPSFDPF